MPQIAKGHTFFAGILTAADLNNAFDLAELRPEAITDQTAKSLLSANDLLLIVDSATGQLAQTSLQSLIFPVGTIIDCFTDTLPTGWLWANGQTIGNASSNATARANADTLPLFKHIWALTSNSDFPILDSGGTPVGSRGASAEDDFAANYQLPLPDLRERGTIGLGTMGGVSSPSRVTSGNSGIDGAQAGAAGGRETLVQHNHGMKGVTITAMTFVNNTPNDGGQPRLQGISVSTGQSYSDGNTPSGLSDNTDNAGSGTGHGNMPPVMVVPKIIKF